MASQEIPIIGPFLKLFIGSRNERFVKRYTDRARAISALEPKMRVLTDGQIRDMLGELRKRHDAGAKSEDLMIEAFAVAREAMDRNVGIRNIFNPKHNFDPSVLPPAARDLFEKARATMEATEPAPPEGAFLGCTDPTPSWSFVEIDPELYEAVRELYPESKPPFRARPFDVQLIGAMVLYQGKIAEMKTGEGKTIVAPLACYLGCAERLQVHVVTVNDYLVQRDRDWTFPYFRSLGMTVGAIHPMHMQGEDVKRRMYRCDVVYGTTSEFGFDYLRDNMKRRVDDQVQRRRQFAVVDEVDSILIDEARTPLIISGAAHDDEPRYDLADRLARHLVEKQKPWADADEKVQECIRRIKGLEGDIRQTSDRSKLPAIHEALKQAKADLPRLEAERSQYTQYFEVKPERKQVHLVHEGVTEAQRAANMGSFFVGENMDVPHLLEQALRSHVVYQRDKDYVIMNTPNPQTGRTEPGIVIVDVNTGRPMVGRQWSDGLHQAIECKEKVPIKQETQTVATITIQNYFKMYKRLAGMTGTADTEAQEFHDIYKLDVVAIPTNKPMVRRDHDDLVYLRAKDKWSAIVDEIKAFNDVGRPILVGTTSVEKSEMLSQMLTRTHGVPHEVLNAKQHEREAMIVEGAGQLGAVMIATNMAGRGTDIKLGALSRQQLLDHWLRRSIAPRTLTVDATDDQLREAVYRKIAPAELDDVKKREVESIPFEELELKLLRHWAAKFTLLTPRDVEKLGAEDLRTALDDGGRCLLHRIRWFEDIEDLGGLHVIATERHEARRIDNQLRGRSGRQGDRGSSRFYVAMDDDLMKMFAGDAMNAALARMGMKEGVAIQHPWLSKSIERAQRKVEEHYFQVRKNLLEYDEVMEHQRQNFYGTRQRVLEGRDLKSLNLGFIERSVNEAVEEYLTTEYGCEVAAEFARERLGISIEPERLKGREPDELEGFIRREARHDAAHTIEVTIGEYMSREGSEAAVEFDREGLLAWAKREYGVDLDPTRLAEGGLDDRSYVVEQLTAAAFERIDAADLAGIDEYVRPEYGARQLADWVGRKLGVEVSPDELLAASRKPANEHEDDSTTPAGMIMKHARELYQKREIEYPVDFALEMTVMIARNQSRDEAAAQIVAWANRRFQLGWDIDKLKTTTPQKVRQELIEASRRYVDEGRLDAEINTAVACDSDDRLDAHFRDRYGVGIPDTMRFLTGAEREEAIRARVENIQRAELLYLERAILLDILDQSWKDHLYSMDQLRDTIGFRAFSQQDPRIEYKREGARLFKEMMASIRDKVTDYIFKARLSPGGGQAAQRPPARPAARGPVTSTFAGPGFDAGPGGQPARMA